MMRHRFLSVAITMLLLVYCSSMYAQLFIILISCIYHFKFLRIHTFLLLIFLVLFLMYINKEPPNITTRVFRIDEIHDTYIIASNKKQKCMLTNIKDTIYLYDVIEVKGNLSPIASNQNLGMFHFATYMKQKGITSSIYVSSYTLKARSNHMKAKLYRHIQQIPNVQTKQHLNTLLYRNREKDMEYQHFLFASGIHLQFLSSLIARLLHKNKHIVSLFCSGACLLLLPYGEYMVRIFVFSLVSLSLSQIHDRERFGISVIALLLIRPFMAFTPTFVIPICYHFVYLFDCQKTMNKIKQTLVLIPLQLLFFHQVNIMTILFFPLFSFLQGSIFMIAILCIMSPSAYSLLNISMNMFIYLLSFLPLSLLIIGKPFYIWLLIWCKSTYQIFTYKQKQNYVYILLLLILQWQMKNITPYGEVSFIDIGQGDCILIREAFNGKVMLIDVANKIGKDYAKTIVYPFLQARGIKHIDVLVVTHDDYDHSGGVSYLQNYIPISNIITTKQDIDLMNLHFSTYQSENAIDENDKSLVLFANINHLNYLFMGDASKQVEKELIDKYNSLQVDVLKVGHHGSNTSSDADFITSIHPKLAIISSGRNNRYKHPHQEVIDTLQNNHVYIANTQTKGSFTIVYSPFGNVLISGDNTLYLGL